MFVLGENHFLKCGCLVGLENRIFRKSIFVDRKEKALTTEMNFRSYFHFFTSNEFWRERERERESERVRGRRAPVQSNDRRRTPSSSSCRSHTPVDLQSAPSIAISPSRQSRSTLREISVARDLAKHRAVEPS